MRALVLADTHVRRAEPGLLPSPVYAEAAAADVILHAGDVVTGALLDELAGYAPVHAVLGNNDDAGLASRLPETVELEFEGVRVAMVHDSGARKGREGRMRRHFPAAEVVVFGHSHDPVDAPGAGGQWLFNPGSPTQRRRQPTPSYGVLDLADGQMTAHRIVRLTRR